jgi:leucyl aminopeptidase (aminopeptidase T)
MAMRKVARDALTHVLGAKQGEHLLVVVDEHRIEIGNAFYEAGDQLDLEGRLFVLEDSERPLEDVPADLRRAMQGANIVVNLFVAYAEETPFRVKLLSVAESAGSRVGHGPGITDDMMTRGAMFADFKRLREHADLLMRRLAGSESAHLTGPGGTDLRMVLGGREFVTDVVVLPGSYGNLPPGEIWVAPVEDSVEGTFVCDTLVHDIGPVSSPLKFEIVKGRVASIRGDDARLVDRVRELVSLDEEASVVGELGVGINPSARLTGNMLEDGKRAGMVRLALGNNEDLPGGRNRSRTHVDLLMRDPTLKVELKGGRVRTIVEDGQLAE